MRVKLLTDVCIEQTRAKCVHGWGWHWCRRLLLDILVNSSNFMTNYLCKHCAEYAKNCLCCWLPICLKLQTHTILILTAFSRLTLVSHKRKLVGVCPHTNAIIIIESYTEYTVQWKKYKNTRKMHKTHSHRQVNTVNYLELEQMAVIQLMISVQYDSIPRSLEARVHIDEMAAALTVAQRTMLRHWKVKAEFIVSFFIIIISAYLFDK